MTRLAPLLLALVALLATPTRADSRSRVYVPLATAPATWQPVTESCWSIDGDTLRGHCISAGLVSAPLAADRLDVTVEARVDAPGRFWVGLALNSDVAADRPYVEAAITRGIAPFWDVAEPASVLLADGGNPCCATFGPAGDGWHTLGVRSHGGRATVSVDGQVRETAIDLGLTTQIELVCVAVDPGERGGAPIDCAFRNLQVRYA